MHRAAGRQRRARARLRVLLDPGLGGRSFALPVAPVGEDGHVAPHVAQEVRHVLEAVGDVPGVLLRGRPGGRGQAVEGGEMSYWAGREANRWSGSEREEGAAGSPAWYRAWKKTMVGPRSWGVSGCLMSHACVLTPSLARSGMLA